MAELKTNFTTYSSKGINVGGTSLKYGVNEMAETAFSMYAQGERRSIVEGVTKDIENEFLNDVVQDGLSAGLGYFTGQAMQLQETLLDGSYKFGRNAVMAFYGSSFVKEKFKKFAKGRKAQMFSKFLSGSDKKAEESRLMADFVKMDLDTSSSSHNPIARQKQHEAKYMHENLEVKKEGVRANLALLQAEGLNRTFQMKMETSSFFVTDKKLIKQITGMLSVTENDIKKLNAMSSAKVFQDSNGEWVGGNEAMVILMNGLGLHRA